MSLLLSKYLFKVINAKKEQVLGIIKIFIYLCMKNNMNILNHPKLTKFNLRDVPMVSPGALFA